MQEGIPEREEERKIDRRRPARAVWWIALVAPIIYYLHAASTTPGWWQVWRLGLLGIAVVVGVVGVMTLLKKF
jgi:hypothetical protein